MKRGMAGGAHRGPVGHGRQRRTIRLVQGLMVLVAAGLLLFAGYSLGRSSGLRAQADALNPPNDPSMAQVWVPGVIGTTLIVGAIALQGEKGVRILTPQRLRELDDDGPVPVGPAPDGPKSS